MIAAIKQKMTLIPRHLNCTVRCRLSMKAPVWNRHPRKGLIHIADNGICRIHSIGIVLPLLILLCQIQKIVQIRTLASMMLFLKRDKVELLTQG